MSPDVVKTRSRGVSARMVFLVYKENWLERESGLELVFKTVPVKNRVYQCYLVNTPDLGLWERMGIIQKKLYYRISQQRGRRENMFWIFFPFSFFVLPRFCCLDSLFSFSFISCSQNEYLQDDTFSYSVKGQCR